MDRSLSLWPFSSEMSSQLSSFRPKLDINETDKQIVVSAELPGMKKEDVHLNFNEGCLEIKGQKEEVKKRDDTTYHVSERSYGSFMRRIPLPQGVKESDIKAGMKEGLLEIHINKPEQEAASNKGVKIHIQ
jgi:HSP20 family protein